MTSPAKALFAAVAAERDRVLLVLPTDAEVETMTRDARFFYSALEGLSETEVERVVLPFPSHEVDPYRGLAPHIGVTSVRARALYARAFGALPARDRRAQRPGLVMAAVYQALLNEIERDGFRVLDRRISLAPAYKAWTAWKASWQY